MVSINFDMYLTFTWHLLDIHLTFDWKIFLSFLVSSECQANVKQTSPKRQVFDIEIIFNFDAKEVSSQRQVNVKYNKGNALTWRLFDVFRVKFTHFDVLQFVSVSGYPGKI